MRSGGRADARWATQVMKPQAVQTARRTRRGRKHLKRYGILDASWGKSAGEGLAMSDLARGE